MTRHTAGRHRGAALIALLALIGLVAVALVLGVAKAAADRSARDRLTAAALGKAVEALVARAANDANRPGSLPCPDTDNNGSAELFAGANCPSYIGRLPWKTLDLPDLRDGDGERLWYALSPVFRDYPPGVNSDTAGQLQVTGMMPATNVIAIVFSPGASVGSQNRDSAGENVVSNYLEGENANGDSTYSNAPRTDTFNDQLLIVTSDDLMPAVERRVAREAKTCLSNFAARNLGRFPWAAPLSSVTYDDSNGTLAGRIPAVLDDSGGSGLPSPAWSPASPPGAGTVTWPSSSGSVTTPCFGAGTWWDRWRDLLLYQVAGPYAPSPIGACPADCLTVNGVGSVTAVVAVAGRAFSASPTQARPSSTVADYLETDPASGVNNASAGSSKAFARAPVSATPAANFNDKIECIHLANLLPCGP